MKKKVSTRKNPVAESPRPEITVNFSIATALPKHGGYGPARHTARYILRHMRRAGYRTAISVLLAALLTGATGFMAVTRLAYQEMFAQTVVTGTMANPPSNAVLAAQDSPLMNDYYFLGGFPTIIDGIPSGAGYTTTFTNDIERFLKSKYGHVTTYTIAYAEGFDASVFKTGDAVCLIGNSLTDLYGIKLGDDINLLSWERYSGISRMAENDKKAELTKKLLLAGKTFKVAGIINSEDQTRYVGGIPVSIYAPLSETAEEISPYGAYPFPIEYAEFTLANKEAPAALTEYLKQMAQLEHVYTETISYELNTTELDDIRRVRDMLTMLFPIAVAAAVLIGLIAPGLIITQSAKEAATLRVLGTTKRRARCMLALEQAALSVLGMIIAAFGLMAYEPGLFTRCGGTLALCGGLYLLGAVCASAFAAALVTRHKVLELLQVKE